jgi:predicted signal transduction protein with EAL and GGDEF domain
VGNVRACRLFVVLLIAGILVPVFTATDDCALIAAAIDELSPAHPIEVRSGARPSDTDSSAVFWVQFEHADQTRVQSFLPQSEQSGRVFTVGRLVHSVRLARRSGRDPPATS